jgi:hypothetical protein
MTAFVAPTVAETQFSGQYGNQSIAHGTYSPNAAAINDTVFMLKLFAGTKITGFRLCNGANGAGTTADVGLQSVDGTVPNLTYFFAGQATSATGSATSQARPIYLAKDTYVVVTFKGAATSAAGAGNYLDVVVDYEFRGA